MLQAYNWPGNVHELGNVVERALIRSSMSSERKFLRFDELNLTQCQPSATSFEKLEVPFALNMNEAMKRHIESVLQMTNGKVGGEDGAAVLLDLPPSTLRNRMIKFGMLPLKKLEQFY